jgi:Flp pilus assembly protein TadD
VDFWPLARTGWPGLVREKAPLFAAAAAVGVATFVVGQRGGIVASLTEVGIGPRLVNAVIGYALYPLQLVWPVGLYAQVPFRHAAPWWQLGTAAVFLVGMSWMSLRCARRAPWFTWGWWWYVVSMLPVSGLAQQGVHGTADRYTYVPFIGLFVIVAWGGAALARRLRVPRPATAIVVVAVLATLAALTHAQVGVWRDSLTLFTHALARNPDNPMAHVFLGRGLEARGRTSEAAASYRAALALDPHHRLAHFQLGRLLARAGDPAGAVRHYEEALDAYGDAADVQRDLGNQYLLLGDQERAAAHLVRALEIEPGHAGARSNLALVRLAQGRYDAAQELLEQVMDAKPDDPRVRYNLACVASRRGDVATAAARLREAFARGFADREAVAADPDLANLRAAPGYEEFRPPRAPSGR